MVFKFSKNTIYKGKLHRKDDEIDTNDAVSLAERGFGTIINENVEDTTAPGEDETNTEGKKPVSQSTARKGSRADAK